MFNTAFGAACVVFSFLFARWEALVSRVGRAFLGTPSAKGSINSFFYSCRFLLLFLYIYRFGLLVLGDAKSVWPVSRSLPIGSSRCRGDEQTASGVESRVDSLANGREHSPTEVSRKLFLTRFCFADVVAPYPSISLSTWQTSSPIVYCTLFFRT